MASPQPDKRVLAKEDASAIGTAAFEAMEREFELVLRELADDEGLGRFRSEYEKLLRALRTTQDGERRLVRKVQDLNAEIVNNAAKVQTALKLSQEDQQTIGNLKREIEKAWKMVDTTHEKEARARDTIQLLKKEIAALSQLVEQGAGLTAGQEAAVGDVLRAKEELTRERDSLTAQIVGLRHEARDHLERVRRLETENTALAEANEGLKERLAAG